MSVCCLDINASMPIKSTSVEAVLSRNILEGFIIEVFTVWSGWVSVKLIQPEPKVDVTLLPDS